MKYITAFFMAWGNFLKIPCPVKKWDSKLNKQMLAFLPSIGLIVGAFLAAAVFLLTFIQIPPMIAALVIFMVPIAVGGFIHLDGFMDVSDAVLSRRDLDERQRILKDSQTGAFAMVSVVILMISFFAGAYSCADCRGEGLALGSFLMIPIASRAFSGIDVLTKKKISVSQYAQDDGKNGKFVFAILAQLAVYLLVAFAISHSLWLQVLLVFSSEFFASLCFGAFARRQLGGMNGDIAGYEIVTSECIGLITLALCTGLVI